MNPKVTLTSKQIEQFSIDVTMNFEGCVEATQYLKKIYGNEVYDLRTRKADFVRLVESGKSLWILNFLLNTITKEYRAKFISGILGENLYLMESDSDKISLSLALQNFQNHYLQTTHQHPQQIDLDFVKISKKRMKFKDQIAKTTLEKQFNNAQCQSQYLKAYQYILKDSKSNLTRDAVSAFQSLAEATQWKFPSVENHVESTLKDIALKLIDYVGFFVETVQISEQQK